MLAYSDSNMNELTKLLEEAKFTKQEVLDNIDLLTEVLKYVDCHENVHQYIGSYKMNLIEVLGGFC